MKKQPTAWLLTVLASLTFNAHALCVNPDGSLENDEYPSATAWAEMAPACEDPADQAATAPKSITAKQQVPIHIDDKEKAYDRSALAKGDCSTDGGEGRSSAPGIAEMLPVCSL